MVIEKSGDLWTYKADFRVIPTNGILRSSGDLVMGAGVALEAKKRFGNDLARALGRWVEKHGNVPAVFLFHRLMSFPTKNHWKDPADLDLIVRSAKTLAMLLDVVDPLTEKKVVLPRIGCGLGGLTWTTVRGAIAPILDDRFVVLSPAETDAVSMSPAA